mmetsp:Transcript_44904/g.95715  ORF Transcript_44904/g.95715 Transcript_44904/m.95715 type:complete len:210 (+) Transcript_44904:946-1575(+)
MAASWALLPFLSTGADPQRSKTSGSLALDEAEEGLAKRPSARAILPSSEAERPRLGPLGGKSLLRAISRREAFVTPSKDPSVSTVKSSDNSSSSVLSFLPFFSSFSFAFAASSFSAWRSSSSFCLAASSSSSFSKAALSAASLSSSTRFAICSLTSSISTSASSAKRSIFCKLKVALLVAISDLPMFLVEPLQFGPRLDGSPLGKSLSC